MVSYNRKNVSFKSRSGLSFDGCELCVSRPCPNAIGCNWYYLHMHVCGAYNDYIVVSTFIAYDMK